MTNSIQERFPEHLITRSEIFRFNFEKALALGNTFKSSGEIVELINQAVEYCDEKVELENECEDLIELLKQEKDVLEFTIATKNNILSL